MMKKSNIVCLWLVFVTLFMVSCKSVDVPVSSILDSTSLRNGSVSLYHVKDKSGKVTKVITNYILEEMAEMYFVQQYSATDTQEMLRVKMSPKTLNLNLSEIVKVQDGTADQMPKQTPLSSVERSGTNYFLSSTASGKPVNSRIFYDSLVMEQEIMIYMLNCFPFETATSASIHYINVRTQKEGTELIQVEGKETKMYNKQEISVYKVSLTSQGGTVWYMEEKPHLLVEADFSSHTIQLVDWNGI
jgi:hypothetical protein